MPSPDPTPVHTTNYKTLASPLYRAGKSIPVLWRQWVVGVDGAPFPLLRFVERSDERALEAGGGRDDERSRRRRW